MRLTLQGAAIAAVSVAAAIQFVRPVRTNPRTDPARTLFAVSHVPGDVAGILDRACRDCHSNETRWPWYSNMAPISWWVIDHVNHGRSHFNYSDWAGYSPTDAARLLKNSCDFARRGEMPLPPYVRMHSQARLSSSDIETLCSWASSHPAAKNPS